MTNKLVLTVVIDVEDEQEAKVEYESIEDNYIIASATLNGEIFHPSLVQE
jgi:hypothetical protein